MNAVSINTINDKLKNLSDDFVNEIITHIDSLDSSNSNFTEAELDSITKGKIDFDQGNVYTHEQVMKIIKDHIKQKSI